MSDGESHVTLRPAVLGDAEMVFQWRNDPFILEHGSSHLEVPWPEHQKWFAQTVVGEYRRMFIILAQGQAVGQIRFDRTSKSDCIVSVYLLREFTGSGLGVEAIHQGCEAIFAQWSVDRVVACVRKDNPAGHSAFRKAGFREETDLGLCPTNHYTLAMTRRVAVAS